MHSTFTDVQTTSATDFGTEMPSKQKKMIFSQSAGWSTCTNLRARFGERITRCTWNNSKIMWIILCLWEIFNVKLSS